MRKTLYKQLATGLCALALLFTTLAAHAADQALDRIVAIVNDQVITASELSDQLAIARSELARQNISLPAESALRKQVLQHMIDTDLQLQLAKNLGVSVADSQVESEIRDIAKRNHVSVAELQRHIVASGINFAEYKAQIKKQLTVMTLQQQEVSHQVSISDAEIQAVLEKLKQHNHQLETYHLQHILISLPDTPNPTQVTAAETQAQRVIDAFHKGQDFNKLAIAHSSGANALSGGDWGWRKAVELPDIFLKAVEKLKPGEISPPIRTGNGFHIIRLVAKRSHSTQHYLTETHVRHILLQQSSPADATQAKQTIKTIREKLHQGVSFSQLAKTYSQDPNSAPKGGDLGWIHEGMVTPQFQAAMDKLGSGEISEPVKTSYGWHIIQVLGRRKVDEDQAMQKARAKAMVFQRKFEQALQSWLQTLRAQSYIKILAA